MSPVALFDDLTDQMETLVQRNYALKQRLVDKFEEGTERWIDFLNESNARNCDCPDGKPVLKERVIRRSGKKLQYHACSSCGRRYYKHPDFSFIGLIIGSTGGGKSTSGLNWCDILHKLDGRGVDLWQCPQDLIDELHSVMWCKKHHTVCERAMGEVHWDPNTYPHINAKGKQYAWHKNGEIHRVCNEPGVETTDDCFKCPHFKDGLTHFRRVETLEQVGFGNALFIDEGILSLNAKEALSKDKRDWAKFLMVSRHKRLVVFCLLQRYDIIRAIREACHVIVYKRVNKKTVQTERTDKFLVENINVISRLEKHESVIASDHPLFEGYWRLDNFVPEWFTPEISMSYATETGFLGQRDAKEGKKNLVIEMGRYLVRNGFTIDSSDKHAAAKAILWETFNYYEPTISDIVMAINYYRKILCYDIPSSEVDPDEDDNDPGLTERVLAKLGKNITKGELMAFRDFVFKKIPTFGKFKDTYGLTEIQARKVIQKVGSILFLRAYEKHSSDLGDDGENFFRDEAWDGGGWAVRSVGSGGITRGGKPSPDLTEITPEGMVRVVQVKAREPGVPKTNLGVAAIDPELLVDERISEAMRRGRHVCPHCMEVLPPEFLRYEGTWLYAVQPPKPGDERARDPIKERVFPEDNKVSLEIDWIGQKIRRKEPTRVRNKKLQKFLESDHYICAKMSEDPDGTDDAADRIFNLENFARSASEAWQG